MKPENINVNIDDKLFLDRFLVDTVSHLSIIDRDVCVSCAAKPCTKFCPASVYEWKTDHISVGYEGCLECGACRIGCPYGNIGWVYPRGGFGVQYRLA